MKYDFDQIIDRRGTNCVKYDAAEGSGKSKDILPMWIADMDFQTAAPITERVREVIDHRIYGYTEIPDRYGEAVTEWYRKNFHWETKKEWILKTPGVVFALNMAVQAYTDPGDSILIQRPVYYPFTSAILQHGRNLVNSPLQLINGKYEIDFQDMEQKIVEHQVKLFILCSPHNPVGRVWTREELQKVGEICKKHQVLVVADEIHSDFTFPGNTHTVFASICPEFQDMTITCTAPSKTFNLAGFQVSNIFISNPQLRERFEEQMQKTGYHALNLIGMTACMAAYEEGQEWLDQLRDYLTGNLEFVKRFLEESLPEVKLIQPEGTYLLWLDLRGLSLESEEREALVVEKANLWLDQGEMFGPEGEGFERMNIACPRAVVKKALVQLKQAIHKG